MSITIGLYDLFAYTIPGLLYLYVFNEALRAFRLPAVDITQVDKLFHLVLIAVGAYVAGHLFDTLGQRAWHKAWNRLWRRKRSAIAALDELKNNYGKLGIQFEPEQWEVLLASLRLREPELTRTIDKYEADSLMLRNLSLGLLLLSILQVWLIMQNPQAIQYLLYATGALILSFVAMVRGNMFHQWFKSSIFQGALNYGTSLDEVLENTPDSGEERLKLGAGAVEKNPQPPPKPRDKNKRL